MTIPVMRVHPFITVTFSCGATPAFDYQIIDIGFVNGINANNQLTSVVCLPAHQVLAKTYGCSDSLVVSGPLFVFDITIVQGTTTAHKFRLYLSQNTHDRAYASRMHRSSLVDRVRLVLCWNLYLEISRFLEQVRGFTSS